MTFLLRAASAAALLVLPALASPAGAHCDTLDGPVVKAAQRALDTGEAAHVLIWVEEADEAEVRAVFAQARRVRALDAEARALADRYFFETVVRLHRSSEHAPFTGLKPAGTTEPIIAAADRALEGHSPAALTEALTGKVAEGIRARYAEARHAREAMTGTDLRAGRAYVHAYVAFVEYVEKVHAAAAAAEGH